MQLTDLRKDTYPNNAWVEFEDDGEVYLRFGRHLINGEVQQTLDLANARRDSRADNMYRDGRYPSSGFMLRLIESIELHALNQGVEYVYVESVLNEFLPAWFERHGYTFVTNSNPACYYKQIA